MSLGSYGQVSGTDYKNVKLLAQILESINGSDKNGNPSSKLTVTNVFADANSLSNIQGQGYGYAAPPRYGVPGQQGYGGYTPQAPRRYVKGPNGEIVEVPPQGVRSPYAQREDGGYDTRQLSPQQQEYLRMVQAYKNGAPLTKAQAEIGSQLQDGNLRPEAVNGEYTGNWTSHTDTINGNHEFREIRPDGTGVAISKNDSKTNLGWSLFKGDRGGFWNGAIGVGEAALGLTIGLMATPATLGASWGVGGAMMADGARRLGYGIGGDRAYQAKVIGPGGTIQSEAYGNNLDDVNADIYSAQNAKRQFS